MTPQAPQIPRSAAPAPPPLPKGADRRASDGRGDLHDALAIVVDRIYRRDPDRFRKLIVWVKASMKTGWLTEDLRKALLAFEARDVQAPITDWWPWLNAARQKARTMRIQTADKGYTPGEFNNIRTILAQIAREIGKP